MTLTLANQPFAFPSRSYWFGGGQVTRRWCDRNEVQAFCGKS